MVVNYHSSAEGAEAVVRQIREGGGKALAIRADVSSAAEVGAMVDRAVKEFGRIDVLVNNSGAREAGRYPGGRRAGLGPGAEREPEGRLSLPAGLRTGHARSGWRSHRQHLVGSRGPPVSRIRALRCFEGCGADADAQRGGRARAASHPREQRRARRGRDTHQRSRAPRCGEDAGAECRRPAGTHRSRRTKWRRWRSSSRPMPRPTSPAPRTTSMAGSCATRAHSEIPVLPTGPKSRCRTTSAGWRCRCPAGNSLRIRRGPSCRSDARLPPLRRRTVELRCSVAE